ncbi:hypothetical protein KCMC57_up04410 [Kitasatospora sp. CMC57]|uniref:Hemerythrin-like domain-containing protein n=1 Tax=Kitasatospora sp. CMC57 TaxID=3231513 RepID=A0AB33JRY8_9ACTN
MAASLAAAEAAVLAWEPAAAEDERDALVAALTEHRTLLTEHLDDEERELLPLAARQLRVPEWNALGEHFLTSTPTPKLLLFLGIVLEDANPSEHAMVLGGLPRPARLLWSLVCRPLYDRRVRTVRGTRP